MDEGLYKYGSSYLITLLYALPFLAISECRPTHASSIFSTTFYFVVISNKIMLFDHNDDLETELV